MSATHIHKTHVLSHREKQVLRGIALGYTNDKIADELELSPETIKTYVRNILYKLDARSRAHAVNLGWEQGILS